MNDLSNEMLQMRIKRRAERVWRKRKKGRDGERDHEGKGREEICKISRVGVSLSLVEGGYGHGVRWL